MKKHLILILLLLNAGFVLQAQYTRHIIRLTDKKGTAHSLANPSTYLSGKAITRRTRQHISIDSTDLPVSATYIDAISKVPNVTILSVSKWLNQILIRTEDANALTAINGFSFVQSTAEAGSRARRNGSFDMDMPVTIGDPVIHATARTTSVTDISYGNTYNQLHIHEGEYLHNLGFTGKGIVIAILDAGFRSYKTNPAFDSVRLQNRVLGERDYVNYDNSVNEDDSHGAACFSIMASNRPGFIVGSAPHASYWLVKTEDNFSEYPVEMHNWAAGAEFADSAGADMISSSLGYANGFTNPAFDIPYAQRDGNTSMVTIAADLAAKKGILVVNSAGNNGNFTNDFKYVSCPADADSVLTVGATNVTGDIAGFSSWGPNGAGRLKPNIVSVGQATVFANTAGTPVSGNGTSFAAPNVAGLIACLWQAFPEFTNMEIIDAVQKSANKYTTPDTRFGFGLPNFRKAYEALAKERESRSTGLTRVGEQGYIKVYPVPFNRELRVVLKAPVTGKAFLRVTDMMGIPLTVKNIDVTSDELYTIEFSLPSYLSKGVYYIQYGDGTNKQTLPLLKR